MHSVSNILPWLEPLMNEPFVWREIGSAGGIRVVTHLRDSDGKPLEYLNLVTALAVTCGGRYQSGDYHLAADAIGLPADLASALIRVGDNNLPESHEFYPALTRFVEYLTKGGNL